MSKETRILTLKYHAPNFSATIVTLAQDVPTDAHNPIAFSEAPHSRDVGHLMAKATEVALTVVYPNRSRAAGYSDKMNYSDYRVRKYWWKNRTF